MGRLGWVRLSAWIWLFSSTHSTTEPSRGLRYKSTTSASFSSERLSLDSSKVSTRCGVDLAGVPYLLDRRLGEPRVLGHRAHRPVRGAIRRAGVQGGVHHLFDAVLADRRLGATTGAHLSHPVDAVLGEALAPAEDRRARH